MDQVYGKNHKLFIRLFTEIKKYIIVNSERTKIVYKNIFYSGIIKVLSILLSIISVPLTLNYLNQELYGIWLTIFSIMNWLMYFDGGLGSGLKNKFTESKAKNDIIKIKTYISTSYFVLSISVIILISIFSLINNFINWEKALNIVENKIDLNSFMQIIFIIFSLQFLFRLIESILIADQRSREADFINFISTLLSLIVFISAKNLFQNKLLFTGIVFCAIPVFVNIVYSYFLFKNRYNAYKPSITYIDLNHYKDLMKLGTKFFVIQMCNLITVGTINLLISNTVNPQAVVIYNLSYKYYSFSLLIFNVVTTSIFTSFNDAFHKNDFEWIRALVKKVKNLSYFIIFCILIMVLMSKYIFNLWIGEAIEMPISSLLLMALYFILTIWVTVYSTFITGIGKIKIAYYFSLLNTILFLPVTYYSGKLLGLNGILLSQMFFILPGLYWLPKQYSLIINNKAYGIWNK